MLANYTFGVYTARYKRMCELTRVRMVVRAVMKNEICKTKGRAEKITGKFTSRILIKFASRVKTIIVVSSGTNRRVRRDPYLKYFYFAE